ncbi:hypothetical protein [Pseudomonas promysalinigenes]|uniref:Pre-toxin TG domain-containing protein n=1 Tax=Pseudomonas promysalinigenes TaxID=485898 RepID=A0ABY6AL49_9PSED|nr:hypothetical protein [Pseudomonas promysalinigenes]UXH38275.1 hypothetical protein N5C08_14880 [Pseudomonas promysalinigenes]
MSEQPVQLDSLDVRAREVPLRKIPGGPDKMFVQTDGNGNVLVDFADGVDEWGKSLKLDETQYEALRQEAFRRELADLEDIPTYAQFYPSSKNSGVTTTPNGNTLGRVSGETPATGDAAEHANPEVESENPAEGITGDEILDGLQLGLDVVGLIPVFGEVADLANAGISLARGDYAGAASSLLSAVPFVGYLGTAGKVGKYGAKVVSDASSKAAKETGEYAAKRVADKPSKDAAEEHIKDRLRRETNDATKAGTNKASPGAKGKGRKKLKCGEYGNFGELKKKIGKGKYDRDHIPSKAALKSRAEFLKGDKLTKEEAKTIERWGNSIAVPRQAHIDISPTYGQNLSSAAKDAADLARSARRDVEAMLKKIDEYDADGGCKKAYMKAAKRVLKDNDWFDKKLNDIINSGL